MKFIELLESIVIDEAHIDNIRNKFVGDGKPISEELYQEISTVSLGKPAIITWMISRIVDNSILPEDVYKYKEYFHIFNKYKNLFPKKDLLQIKNPEDVIEFRRKCTEIREKDAASQSQGQKGEVNKDSYVSMGEMKKLEDVGIKFLGMCDGYQVFEVPNECKDSEEAYTTYKNILGRCSGRDKGAKIDICTIANIGHFKDYLEKYPGSSYFVAFNMSDSQSPYQIHFESQQYMDKNDNPLL